MGEFLINLHDFGLIVNELLFFSHTLFSECLVLTSVWHVCLPFSNISNSCH